MPALWPLLLRASVFRSALDVGVGIQDVLSPIWAASAEGL